jgi:hypothetical protein
MKNFEMSDKNKKDWAGKLKKYPKPWTQETHDKFIKERGMTEKEHEEWHRQNDI